jgi:FMN phosphatase YigB (HAD superfamily)
MKLILFDLGRTLEDGDVLRPGALETLKAIESLRAGDRPAAQLGLVSDFDMTTDPAEVPIIQRRYFQLLDRLGIRSFFEPVEARVTLSTEVGVRKPDPAIFRTAVHKAHPGLGFDDVLFVTENLDHVLAARRLGIAAAHLRAPGHPHGEVDALPELVPIVRAFVEDEHPIEAVVLPVRSDGTDALMHRAAAEGVTWTRLGDELVVRGPAAQVSQLIGGSDAARSVHRSGLEGQRLHLVTQIGRQFQHDHPDVPVVVDKGRYLVVDLDPRRRLLADDAHAGCYAVRPLPADTVVFAQRDPGPGVARTMAGGPADRLSRAAFEADLGTLAAMRTRHSADPGFRDALEWARNRLTGLGYDTHVQPVTLDAGTTHNLVADRTGEGDVRGVVLVTAHLDSVNRRGPAAAAPGADDNASGAAGVIAIGHALAHLPTTHDLRLVLFGGEEQGLFGSRQYVNGLDAAERARIIAVVNMDMIACLNSESPTVLLEGAATSQAVIDALADAAHAHTSLVVQTSLAPFNSDHVPFLDRGIAAVLTIEGTDGANDRVHTERDTVESLDVDLALQILRMNVAFVARAVKEDRR